jgi:F-type H+-transporting ATPase subunit a
MLINLKALWDVPKKIKEEPMILMINAIKFLVGFIEIISEIAKVISLSFRLFGNVFAGEVLIASMSAILAFGLPLPFNVFGSDGWFDYRRWFFTMLVLSYLSMATVVRGALI